MFNTLFVSTPWLIRHCPAPLYVSWTHIFMLFLVLNYKLLKSKIYLAYLPSPEVNIRGPWTIKVLKVVQTPLQTEEQNQVNTEWLLCLLSYFDTTNCISFCNLSNFKSCLLKNLFGTEIPRSVCISCHYKIHKHTHVFKTQISHRTYMTSYGSHISMLN